MGPAQKETSEAFHAGLNLTSALLCNLRGCQLNIAGSYVLTWIKEFGSGGLGLRGTIQLSRAYTRALFFVDNIYPKDNVH